MIVSMHQPHYFPWLGYLDKMAKADVFIISDEKQLTEKSPMVRNMFLQNDDAVFLSVSICKKGYHDKKANEIELFNENVWKNHHEKFLIYNYGRHPYFNEIWPEVEPIFRKEHTYLVSLSLNTIHLMRKLFDIHTTLILQSSLSYDADKKKNELNISVLQCVSADVYLSGNGARKYMIDSMYADKGIKVVYQQFAYPVYPQYKQNEFIPNLSALDLLFNCGIEKSREIFWENVKKTDEFHAPA